MPGTRIAARLEIVEAQIGLTQATIDAQRALVETMRDRGYATWSAETHRTILEARLVQHEAERAKLRAQLGLPD